MADESDPTSYIREPDDLELVAIWLHGAAREMDMTATVRGLIRRAMDHANGLYVHPQAGQLDQPEDGDHGAVVVDAVGRFAAEWDKLDRQAGWDAEADPQPQ